MQIFRNFDISKEHFKKLFFQMNIFYAKMQLLDDYNNYKYTKQGACSSNTILKQNLSPYLIAEKYHKICD